MPKRGKPHPIAIEVQKILDEPLWRRAYPRLGTKVLRAVFNAIAQALKRGERVTIAGFGTFKVVQRKPRTTASNYLTQTQRRSEPRHYPPRHYVVFQPALPLLAMLNLPEDGYEPNYTERRTQSRWTAPEVQP